DVAAFVQKLEKDYPVERRVLKRLVMQEYYRTRVTPLYDLEYDIQLKAAVDILLEEDVRELLKATNTVQEIQQSGDNTMAVAEPAE
ncbi:MAG: peptidase S41, partial [Treponema sp.]|nr:peptidase S41 [Treponema sp.]